VYYGGVVAAPVFSVIAKSVLSSLGVPPDSVGASDTVTARKVVQAPTGGSL
jgi:hypothetical protein